MKISAATVPGHLPLPPGQDREEPEQAFEDDIPSRDHDVDGGQPGAGRAHDGDEVERHAE